MCTVSPALAGMLRIHLTQYHGVFAPHSKLRAAVTPAHRGMGAPQSLPAADVAKPPTTRHVAMSWARRLKRVFGIEIEDCAAGAVASAVKMQCESAGR